MLTDRLAQLLRCADRLVQSFLTQSTEFPAVSLSCSQKPIVYATLHFLTVQQHPAECSSCTYSVAELREVTEVVMYCMCSRAVGRSAWFVLITKCYWGYKMGEDEIGGACGTYGAGRKCVVRC